MTIDELEARLRATEDKADRAAEIAMTAVAVHRNLFVALEKGHEQMAEMLIASRQLSRLAESLAQSVLGGLPRTKTPMPVQP